MSKLSVGIVGLPNVGKSTLFNALLKKQQAFAANFPFATIDPNIGIVPVPDSRLNDLAQVTKEEEKMSELPPIVPATVEFMDIAGLIAGAHKGEGLGNKFLAHIREADAICHVVRAFSDNDIIREGSSDPKSDFETIQMELALADLQTLEKQREPKGASVTLDDKIRWRVVQALLPILEQGKAAHTATFTDEEMDAVKTLNLLTMKPILVALNISEDDLPKREEMEAQFATEAGLNVDQVIAISAKMESQLAGLSGEEAQEYLQEMGVESSGLERLIRKAFATLGLITFLTAGVKEVRAWTITDGMLAPQAAGVIHTDFEKKFIKADVVPLQDFIENGGWKVSREKGKVRQEGREYVMQDGDVVEFKIGS